MRHVSTHRDGLLRKRLEQFTRTLDGLEKGDVRALHRSRVATRRLRELLPVLQLDAVLAEKLSRRLRKATERLGSVRELDVLLHLTNDLQASDRYEPEATARVGASIDRERKACRKKLMAKAPVAELHRLARKLDKVAGVLESERLDERRKEPTRRGWRWAADARVAQRAARLVDVIAAAGAIYLPERLHSVRIGIKKLRYAVEVAGEAGGAAVTADLRRLKHVQGVLGRLHDLQVLVDRTRQAQAWLTPPNVTVWRALEAMVDGIDADCRRLHGRYMTDRDALIEISRRLSHAGRTRPAPRRATA